MRGINKMNDRDCWETPQELWNKLDENYGINWTNNMVLILIVVLQKKIPNVLEDFKPKLSNGVT